MFTARTHLVLRAIAIAVIAAAALLPSARADKGHARSDRHHAKVAQSAPIGAGGAAPQAIAGVARR
jgi:hypothetical protein